MTGHIMCNPLHTSEHYCNVLTMDETAVIRPYVGLLSNSNITRAATTKAPGPEACLGACKSPHGLTRVSEPRHFALFEASDLD
jgi:hypothetical protein